MHSGDRVASFALDFKLERITDVLCPQHALSLLVARAMRLLLSDLCVVIVFLLFHFFQSFPVFLFPFFPFFFIFPLYS